jgi:hypothetical protein
MTAKFKIGLRIALILTVVFSGIVAHGQAAQPTRNNDALAVSQIMQTEQIQVGQMPWAILTVCNISDQPVTIRDTRETLIKLSISTAKAATVSADEAEDTGDDEWL